MVQRIMRLKAVIQLTGIPRSTIYYKVAEGSFPKPIKLGPRAVGWLEDEIEAWQQSRIASRASEVSQ